MINPDVITRSKRKTLSIVITSDARVVVKAPLKLSLNEIERFLLSKQSWMEQKLAEISKNRFNNDDIINYKRLMILGTKYDVYKSDRLSKITLDKDRIIIPSKFEDEKLLHEIKKWYKKLAAEIILSRCDELSNQIKLLAKEVKISDTRGRWGACSSRGKISFNFRVVMLPKYMLDYVIIHELSHLVEMNHSAKFWQIVSLYIPNYNYVRRQMKQYNFLLKLL